MPEERGYTRQVAARPGAPMPLARPEDFGAGVARVAGQVAQVAHREALEDYAIERRQTAAEEWARFQHEFGLLREDADRFTREGRKDDTPGHAERMRSLLEPRRERVLEGIGDDEVRRQATAALEEWSGRYLAGERDYAEVQRVDRTLTSWTEAETIAANRLRRLDKPEDFPVELQIGHDAIDGLDLPPERARAAHEHWDQVAGAAYLRGTIDRDPQLAKAMIAGGLFDQLDPDTIEVLLNSADVEIRRDQAEAERAQALAVADFRERVRVAKEQASQGIDNAEALPGLIAEARRLGLEDVAVDLEGVASEAGFAKVWETANPVQRERRIAELEADDARTDQEDRELAWLKDKGPALDSRFNADPAGHYLRTGGAGVPPDIDFADPASLARRARWARTASEAAGRPVPPLTQNEARQLGAWWATGKRADQVTVMDALGAFPADQAAAAARLVAGQDPRLAVLVTLPETYRPIALDGIAALKARPKLVSIKELEPDDQEAIRRYDAHFAEALANVPPGQRDAVLAVAAALTAGAMDGDGADEVTRSRYWKGLQMALGAYQRDGRWVGGLAQWGEHWFLLPDGVTATQFGAAVQREARDGGNDPVNPDGSPAALRRAFPVAVGQGWYEFRTGNPTGPVVRTATGEAWRVRVRAP